MNIVPRYNYPAGTEVTLFSQKMAMNRLTDDGYELTNKENGDTSVVSFSKFVEYLKSPAMRIESAGGMPTSVVELRLGGLKNAEQLSAIQEENGRFHFALCCGMSMLREKRRREMGGRGDHLSIQDMNDPANRKFIKLIAETVFGKKIHLSKVRGGKSNDWFMYQGRTLIKYLNIYDSIGPEDDSVAALASLDHLKGNETQRITPRLREIMTKAWEEVGLDLKGPGVANVFKHLEMLVLEENQSRKRNGLELLIVPSQKTLRAHRDDLLSPSEYLLATKGERYSRNKRGRGSTDIRALMIAEMVEIDECKASLITSAKEKGYWHTLAVEDQEALKQIDEDIRSRLSILVMIDIASRMPLAWIVSDQPRTEATLALLRMATRDKTKEKVIYGCDGDPTPAMGLGMIKNDNGVGLRNAKIKQVLLGSGASSTDARTYASSDKPYVERMFGTVESVLLKLIHGYTGRKPGENGDSMVTDTVRPGQITSCIDGPGVFQIRGGGVIVEHEAQGCDPESTASASVPPMSDEPVDGALMTARGAQVDASPNDKQQRPLGRPKKGGMLL
ncbi:MAG TPA: transposase family protein [Roseovarius sp.]